MLSSVEWSIKSACLLIKTKYRMGLYIFNFPDAHYINNLWYNDIMEGIYKINKIIQKKNIFNI